MIKTSKGKRKKRISLHRADSDDSYESDGSTVPRQSGPARDRSAPFVDVVQQAARRQREGQEYGIADRQRAVDGVLSVAPTEEDSEDEEAEHSALNPQPNAQSTDFNPPASTSSSVLYQGTPSTAVNDAMVPGAPMPLGSSVLDASRQSNITFDPATTSSPYTFPVTSFGIVSPTPSRSFIYEAMYASMPDHGPLQAPQADHLTIHPAFLWSPTSTSTGMMPDATSFSFSGSSHQSSNHVSGYPPLPPVDESQAPSSAHAPPVSTAPSSSTARAPAKRENSEARKAQNRASQRAFRERRDAHVKQLEQENHSLRLRVAELKAQLKACTSDGHVPEELYRYPAPPVSSPVPWQQHQHLPQQHQHLPQQQGVGGTEQQQQQEEGPPREKRKKAPKTCRGCIEWFKGDSGLYDRGMNEAEALVVARACPGSHRRAKCPHATPDFVQPKEKGKGKGKPTEEDAVMGIGAGTGQAGEGPYDLPPHAAVPPLPLSPATINTDPAMWYTDGFRSWCIETITSCDLSEDPLPLDDIVNLFHEETGYGTHAHAIDDLIRQTVIRTVMPTAVFSLHPEGVIAVNGVNV